MGLGIKYRGNRENTRVIIEKDENGNILIGQLFLIKNSENKYFKGWKTIRKGKKKRLIYTQVILSEESFMKAVPLFFSNSIKEFSEMKYLYEQGLLQLKFDYGKE
jgi:hypothetical protein